MTAEELKEVLRDVPNDWIIVVEQPEGDRYHTAGVHGDEGTRELIIEL